MHLAYLASQLPSRSGTFVLNEIVELGRLGHTIHAFSVRRPDHAGLISDAERRGVPVRFLLPVSPLRLLAAHLWAAVRGPRRYLATLLFAVSRRRKGLGRRLFLVFYFAEAVVLARELHRRGLRHVHVHHANNAAIVAMLAARYLRVGYSLTAHGSDVLLERDLLEDKLRHAAFAVAVSEYNRAAMLSCGISPDSPPIHVVHTGVELDRFAPGEARPPHDLDLLSVGRLHEVKAFPDLLRACHRLTRDGLVFRCRIVGDGPSRARLERLRDELGLEDRVEFVGPVGHDELPGYYRESDVFVMASRSEGIPVVLMEAMACGLPVVATDITGIPELVEHGKSGLLVPPGDPDRLARAVAELAASAEKRREYGNAGRRRVRERFDVREGARRLDRLFRERLAEGRDRSGA